MVCDTLHESGYQWHAAKQSYLQAAFEVAGVVPMLVPAFGSDMNVMDVLSRVDGVMLTGSKTNVHPKKYGHEPTAAHEPYDEARDDTSLPLIRAAIEIGVPLFAICRGIQELNVALGGTLATEIQEKAGIADHREPSEGSLADRYRLRHSVNIEVGGCLADIVIEPDMEVNSLHRQAISQVAPTLQVEATAPDGTIEAVSVVNAKSFAVGVQWHPEFWATSDAPSRKLFVAFGDAVRSYAAGRA
ncbi:MAG: gamma-glutamyl-gamma-aminobutyrate hydrolase family protein [Pseudomonadota bacterium]